MKSVPPRGSGWVPLALSPGSVFPSTSLSCILYVPFQTHPLPRGGTTSWDRRLNNLEWDPKKSLQLTIDHAGKRNSRKVFAVLRKPRPHACALVTLAACQRSDAALYQRRHESIQRRISGSREAGIRARLLVAEVPARRR